MLTQIEKTIIISALEMKLASIRRARNSNKSPNFAPVYDLEEKQTQEAITKIREIEPKK